MCQTWAVTPEEAPLGKLLVAIVHRDDAEPVAAALRSSGHRFTLMPSIGGFLASDNATFLLGVEDEVEQDVIALFEEVCHGRDVEVPLVLLERLADWQAATVAYGGATILVADLARIVKI
jgi:uncharacterized protein YaaQ